jgi:hypothetical protein
MNGRFKAIALALLAACSLLASCNSLTLSGRVSVKGNEPLTYLVLVSEEKGAFTIVGPLKEEIRRNHQGKYLKVRGRIVEEPQGPGLHPNLEVLEILEIRSRPF